MPIKGLIETSDTSIRQGLPEIARAYKGEPKTDPRRPGKDLEYFRIEFNPQFEEFEEIFRAMYTDEDGVYEPSLFERVHVAAETTDEAFDFWMEQWNSSMTLLHKCDGDTQVRWFDTHKNMYSNGTMACASKPDNTQPPCECTRVGRLALILTDFTAATGVFGYFLFQTHSINDIITLYQTLSMAEKLARKAGRSLMSVPFTFGRAIEQISAPTTDKQTGERTSKRIKVNKSLFYLHTDPEFTKQVLLPALVNAPALPAPTPVEDSSKILPIGRGSEKIRKALGGGGEPRRMGGTPTPTDAPDIVQGEVTEVIEGTPEDAPPITRTFVATHVKYIANGTQSYMAFIDPQDQPGWLYLKDFEKKFDVLGPEFQTFTLNLRPSNSDMPESLTLPESLTVTVEARTRHNRSFWEVTDLKRVEQDTAGEAKAS